MKEYKNIMIITSCIILIPCLVGIALWKQLPDMVPTHFNFVNDVDGYSNKFFFVFGIPALMLVLHTFSAFATLNDPKRANINRKVMILILFTVPAVTLFCSALTYAAVLGYTINIGLVTNLLMGLLFLGIGNYLPKVKQNYTMGIKIPWTLDSEVNWNKTHRLSGWIWIIGGLLFLANAFLLSQILFIFIVIMVTGIPTLYSFILYKQGN